jgi:hypothetical protein
MDDFLLDCCFNAVYKGQKFRGSTPHYADGLRAMPHSAESRLPTVPHRAELQFLAMRHSAEFLPKISSPTPRYATQLMIMIISDLGRLDGEKTEGQKSHETVPLNLLKS